MEILENGMIKLPLDSLPLQAQAPAGVTKGLPFWMLWLLLCVILLLVVFIFLRDKDLRRRISAFLSGARRHMIRLRLQVKLKKEREKKAALWRELGKLAWSEDVQASCIDEDCGKLAGLEEEIGRLRPNRRRGRDYLDRGGKESVWRCLPYSAPTCFTGR